MRVDNEVAKHKKVETKKLKHLKSANLKVIKKELKEQEDFVKKLTEPSKDDFVGKIKTQSQDDWIKKIRTNENELFNTKGFQW